MKPSPELFLSRADDLAQRLLPHVIATGDYEDLEACFLCLQLAAKYLASYEYLYEHMTDQAMAFWRIYDGISGDSSAIRDYLSNGSDAADVENWSDRF